MAENEVQRLNLLMSTHGPGGHSNFLQYPNLLIPTTSTSGFLLENGSGVILLESGGILLLEAQ